MTNNEKTHRIIQALEETRRFIAKEEARADDLRPTEMAELLAWYKGHEKKLVEMLGAA